MCCCGTVTVADDPTIDSSLLSASNETKNPPLRNIMILGSTGNIGSIITRALLELNLSQESDVFELVLLTRQTSFAKLLRRYSISLASAAFAHCAHVQIATVGTYSDVEAVTKILKQYHIEIFISTIAALSVNDQQRLVDACVAAGTVRRFFPSEFSVDTSSKDLLTQYLPPSILKSEVIDHLRKASARTRGRLTWTAVVTGTVFESGLFQADLIGYNIKAMTATVFDGGQTVCDGTTSCQLGRTLIACLSDENLLQSTGNQYVFINSFTFTQDQILDLFERFSNRAFTRTRTTAQSVFREGKSIMDSKGGLDAYRGFQPVAHRPYPKGVSEMILASTYGGQQLGSLNHYSNRVDLLWNERLGLETEDLSVAVRTVVKEAGILNEERLN